MPKAIWAGKGICFLVILACACIHDIRYRQVPDRYSAMLVILALVHPDVGRLWGVFCACPLLVAALTVGGMGGADIKITGAAGMVLGLGRGMAALTMGLSCMLVYHAGWRLFLREDGRKQSYPLIPFLTIGMCVGYLTLIPV